MANETLYPGIDEYLAPMGAYFHRSEGRDLARCYVIGLMLEGERKSVEPMSERVHASERSLQRLLTLVKWDEPAVLRAYRHTLLAATSDPQGVLAVDDTAFPKKGTESVCVSRQYCGATGKIDNCQIGVSLTYVGQDVAWPYGMELFVPKCWDRPEVPECRARRAKTYMPASAHHVSKWQMALALLDEARAEGVPHRAVVADSWYGSIPEFRAGLEARQELYVVGVKGDTRVFLEPPVLALAPPAQGRGRPRKRPQVVQMHPEPVSVTAIGDRIGEDAWEHLELRRDSKDRPLMAEAVAMRVWPALGAQPDQVAAPLWLIIERRANRELRYHFSNLPQSYPTLEMVRLLHERFWIEHGYQQLKEELGLDHHEGRSWRGWHRHVVLVFVAYGYLTWLRLREKKHHQHQAWQRWIHQRMTLGRELFS